MKVRTTAVVVELSFEKDFLTFLDQNNALERFCTRFCDGRRIDSLASLISRVRPTGWIANAFIWDDAMFWGELSTKWEKSILHLRGCETLFEVVDKDKVEEIWDKLQMYGGSLLGRYYRVEDNSWNRSADQVVDSQEAWCWDDHSWKDLVGKTYLILSEKPVIKILKRWDGSGEISRPFIKIWVPEQECVQWVLLYRGYSFVKKSKKD